MRSLMDDVRKAAGVTPVLPGLPYGVQATVRSGAGGRYLFLLNHGQEPAEVALPEPMADALAPAAPLTAAVERLTLPARGVAVLTDAGPRGGS